LNYDLLSTEPQMILTEDVFSGNLINSSHHLIFCFCIGMKNKSANAPAIQKNILNGKKFISFWNFVI